MRLLVAIVYTKYLDFVEGAHDYLDKQGRQILVIFKVQLSRELFPGNKKVKYL